MITTVFGSTAGTIAAMAGTGLAAAFGIGIGVFLLVLLTAKQVAQAADSDFAVRLGRFVIFGIVPLLIGFGIITAFKLFEITTG